MKITENVITDLLPLYDSGEASPDTIALVDEFLTQNPDFERLVSADVEPLFLSSDESFDSSDMEAILRIKRILNFRSILFGAALFCSLMPFSVVGSSSQGIHWIMFRDLPLLASFFAIAALLSWGGYVWSYLSLRDS